MKYFIQIVQEDCNLSKASSKLFLSQPALSKMINEIEQMLGYSMFHRRNGRLVGLTYIGRMMYDSALQITSYYDQSMAEIHAAVLQEMEHVVIGIPGFLLTTLFSEEIPRIIVEHPNSRVVVDEGDSENVKEKFDSYKLDIAILLQPTNFNKKEVSEILIKSVPLVAFMNEKHSLACKTEVTWQELSDCLITLPRNPNTIYKLVVNKFNKKNLRIKIGFQADEWSYLFLAAKTDNLLTILPSFTGNHLQTNGIISVPINDPIMWNVAICRHKLDDKSKFQDYVFQRLLQACNN